MLDGLLDRDPPKRGTKPGITGALKDLMGGMGLVDIWRRQHPMERVYSCYTPSAGTHSRIDYGLVSSEIAGLFQNLLYLPRYISDHSPFLMTLVLGRKIPAVPLWRSGLERSTERRVWKACRI